MTKQSLVLALFPSSRPEKKEGFGSYKLSVQESHWEEKHRHWMVTISSPFLLSLPLNWTSGKISKTEQLRC